MKGERKDLTVRAPSKIFSQDEIFSAFTPAGSPPGVGGIWLRYEFTLGKGGTPWTFPFPPKKVDHFFKTKKI